MNKKKDNFNFEISNIIKEGHFVLRSGKHSPFYIEKNQLFTDPFKIEYFAKKMASFFIDLTIDAVVGPAVSGGILAHCLAKQLKKITQKEVVSCFVDKNDVGEMNLRQCFRKLLVNKKILLVEDVISTGGSVQRILEILKALDVKIVGLTAMCSRDKIKYKDILSLPRIKILTEFRLISWEPVDCKLCQNSVPIDKRF